MFRQALFEYLEGNTGNKHSHTQQPQRRQTVK